MPQPPAPAMSSNFDSSMAARDDQVVLYPLAQSPHAIVAPAEGEASDPEYYLELGKAASGKGLHHQQAIDLFSEGLSHDPFHAQLYRWRGHRYLNVRQINAGIADLELSTRLDNKDWDAWYHLGLGYYLKHDFARAELAYRRCMDLTVHDEERVAISDWLYMTLMRQGKRDEAESLLGFVTEDTDPGPNTAYHQRLLMYKGLKSPESLLPAEDDGSLDYGTLAYGLGNYYFCNGDTERAIEAWHKAISGAFWSAFGSIAAEVDLRALGAHPG